MGLGRGRGEESRGRMLLAVELNPLVPIRGTSWYGRLGFANGDRRLPNQDVRLYS